MVTRNRFGTTCSLHTLLALIAISAGCTSEVSLGENPFSAGELEAMAPEVAAAAYAARTGASPYMPGRAFAMCDQKQRFDVAPPQGTLDQDDWAQTTRRMFGGRR